MWRNSKILTFKRSDLKIVFWLGSNHLYVFIDPLKPDVPEGSPATIDWDFAQKELAEKSGFSTLQAGMTKGFNISLNNQLTFKIFFRSTTRTRASSRVVANGN